MSDKGELREGEDENTASVNERILLMSALTLQSRCIFIGYLKEKRDPILSRRYKLTMTIV